MQQIELSGGAAGPDISAPELKALVTEATRALARLDIARLEELALSCRALTRMPAPSTAEEREEFGRQARAACRDMAVFARVLEATRANVRVMERLREMRTGPVCYSERSAGSVNFSAKDWKGGNGNN